MSASEQQLLLLGIRVLVAFLGPLGVAANASTGIHQSHLLMAFVAGLTTLEAGLSRAPKDAREEGAQTRATDGQ